MKLKIFILVYLMFLSFVCAQNSSVFMAPTERGALIIQTAEKYVGQRETHGPNRSPFIDKINTFAKVPLGSPYCASFVSWVLYEARIPNAPISAWSPSLVSQNNVSFKDLQQGDVFGLFFPQKKRIAHVGFIKNPIYQNNFLLTVEANTSPTAALGTERDREGDGIFTKIRSRALMNSSRNKFSRF